MRDKIEDILSEISIDHLPNYQDELSGIHKAADDLTALMCYQEVRRYITALRPFHAFQHLDDKDCRDLIYIFRIDYPEQTIQEAIEKYKNEQK